MEPDAAREKGRVERTIEIKRDQILPTGRAFRRFQPTNHKATTAPAPQSFEELGKVEVP